MRIKSLLIAALLGLLSTDALAALAFIGGTSANTSATSVGANLTTAQGNDILSL